MFADALPSWVNTTSSRVTSGLGTIARVVASGETIYRGKLTFAEAERRIEACWKPFHETISALIEATRARFGKCVLIDCHSMPVPCPCSGRGDRLARHQCTGRMRMAPPAPAHLTRSVERRLIDLGYRVRRNDPYAGGFITRHYGRPRDHVHALQIEIARDLYMDETRFERVVRLRWCTTRPDIVDRVACYKPTSPERSKADYRTRWIGKISVRFQSVGQKKMAVPKHRQV